MIDELVQRYAGVPVPRYTSYPTAAEFTTAIGPVEQGRWLETLDRTDPVSLYLHVPYCREICHYCGCNTKMVLRDDVLANYRRILRDEIDRAGRHLPRQMRVARLHWGGGTPSLLNPEGLATILEALAAHFVFEESVEHAIELDPRSVSVDLAKRLAALGVNRVSLGVQDLNPDVQAAIGRLQSFDVVTAAFEALRDAGIRHVNVDLIYGLPRQTVASITATARQVSLLGAERIACYGYAHLPNRKRNQRLIDAAVLPTPIERYSQMQAMADAFKSEGFEAIGIDHFARPDDALALAARESRLYRNFQGYTDDKSPVLIGFGASAISRLEDGFVQNEADPTAYAHAIGRGLLPAVRGYRLNQEDRLRAAVIERLMCDFRVDLDLVGGAEAFADELALLRSMVVDGLVARHGSVIAMTEFGRPFVRLAAAVFDSFRQGAASGFSIAV